MASEGQGIETTSPLTEATPSTTTLRAYIGLLLILWAISALPLAFRSHRMWSTAAFWFHPPFYDFGCFYDRIKLIHQPAFWTSPIGPVWDYPAPNIFVYQLFYKFNRGSGGEHRVFFGFLAYLTFAAAALACAGITLARALHRRGLSWRAALPFVAVSLLFCWPIYFGLQRGNIEFFLDTGVIAGIWAYARRRWWLAAVLLGAFGSGKLYPLLLLSLFLPLKRWKEFLLGLASAAAITLFATAWIGHAPAASQSGQGITAGLAGWITANSLTLDLAKTGYDHSLFGFLKLLNAGHPQRLATTATVYALVAAVGMLLLFFARLWKLPRLNQLLVVSVAAVLLPPTSFDYTLMLLLPVWAWLAFLSLAKGTTPRQLHALLLAVIAFAVIFAPETFAVWHGINFAGQLKMLALLGLLWIGSTAPLQGDLSLAPGA